MQINTDVLESIRDVAKGVLTKPTFLSVTGQVEQPLKVDIMFQAEIDNQQTKIASLKEERDKLLTIVQELKALTENKKDLLKIEKNNTNELCQLQ